jgi:hypothetical protein
MPLSTIFQLYHGGKFIGGRSQNKHEKTTPRYITSNLGALVNSLKTSRWEWHNTRSFR